MYFGFGIVIAGGCECGWMYRAVEGQVHFWIVGVGNIIGATLLAFVWDDISEPLATSWPKINLLESFGQYGGLVANYGLLFLFFIVILVFLYIEIKILNELYEENGVKEYWVIDPEHESISVFVLIKNKFVPQKPLTTEDMMKSSIFPSLEFNADEIFKDVHKFKIKKK